MTDDRLKLWLNFWKIVISSVVVTGGVTLATTLINASLQNKEIAIKDVEKKAEINTKIIEKEKDYLTSFLQNALDENTERKYQFALFFKSLTYSEQFAKGWDEYFKAVDAERKAIQKERDEIQAGLADKTEEEVKKAQARIAELERELSSAPERADILAAEAAPLQKIIEQMKCSEDQEVMIKGFEQKLLKHTGIIQSEAYTSFTDYPPNVTFFNFNVRLRPISIAAYCEGSDGVVGDVLVFDRAGTVVDILPSSSIRPWNHWGWGTKG